VRLVVMRLVLVLLCMLPTSVSARLLLSEHLLLNVRASAVILVAMLWASELGVG